MSTRQCDGRLFAGGEQPSYPSGSWRETLVLITAREARVTAKATISEILAALVAEYESEENRPWTLQPCCGKRSRL